MSEPKLISPMLDNFAMGDPISDDNGIRCCPAMNQDTEDKYIVKIISVPASQNQLEALLLTGAYKDKEDALSYYNQLAEDIIEEAKLLQRLSELEGFIAYEKWQKVPMEEDTGFDVYLLNPYKNSLHQYFRHNAITHLGALNLGLDLCSALTASRRSGYLYVDLKPENIYITGENTYRIGEIGFLDLKSLNYASLPERYRSAYTAPEIQDAYSALNTTIDVYAMGLIMYQAFNDGTLPFRTDSAPEEAFPPPAYADYEMAEIILKACAPDPADRWQDPAEMGQALVSYMQRNGVNDTPIVPISVAVEVENETEQPECDENITITEAQNDDEETVAETETVIPAKDLAQETEENIYEVDEEGNLTFLSVSHFIDDIDEAEGIDYQEITEEVSEILVQADDLIAHQTPDPVIPPEPIDVPIPDPIVLTEDAEETEYEYDEKEPSEEAEDNWSEEETEAMIDDVEECNSIVEVQEDGENPETIDGKSDDEEIQKPSKKSHWLRNTLLALIGVAILTLGFLYYTNFYIQPVESIVLDESEVGCLTVHIKSEADESKLTVICSDTYGNQLYAPVENGQAKFTNLAPNSAYTIKVAINGFHKLTGDTSAAFTTPAQTEIVQFNAVTGSEDGSAILSFTINGRDAEQWIVRYCAEGEDEKEIAFTGHVTTVTGLTIGKTYEFALLPAEDLLIAGTDKIQHTASAIVKAEDLQITGCANNVLTTVWSAPKDVTVESWTVRCYNESGYDETQVVTETKAVFEGTAPTSDYTVEVTAAGMSVSQRAFAAANSLTVIHFAADDSDPNQIILTWEPLSDMPEGGWIVKYTINGSTTQEIGCSQNTATIPAEIPGVHYTITLVAANGTPVLVNNLSFDTPGAKAFEGYGVSAEAMTFRMCKTPRNKNWDRYDLSSSDYTTQFESGRKASFLVHLNQSYSTSADNITSLFVVKDADGMIVATSTSARSWTDMWYRNYCELDIPTLPKTPGNYTVSVYFNGMLAKEQGFSITN